MIKISFFIITLLNIIFFPSFSSAEEPVDSYSDRIVVRASGVRPSLNLTVERGSHEVIYNPNTLVNGKMGVTYGSFGFSFGKELNGSQKDEIKYGKTEYKDFQLKYFSGNLGFIAFLQQYKGFYLENPEDFGNIPGDQYAKRADLKAMNSGLNAFYVFSDNFSLQNTLDQSVRQKKSGGSFLAMVTMSRFLIDADRSLIPPAKESDFADTRGYRGGKHTGIAVAPGVGYTLVFNKFFISGALFVGAGLMQKYQKTDAGEETSYEPFGRNNINLSIGYNSDSFFAGFMLTNDMTLYKSDVQGDTATEVRISSITSEVYAGIRW